MWTVCKRALLVSLALWILLAWGYNFALLGLSRLAFPAQAGGSVITLNGQPVAAAHVGQNFATSPQYFWGRPSATVSVKTGKPEPYNAFNSGASNLGPTNAKLLADIRRRVSRYLAATPDLTRRRIPLSLVESSGSGLDPDITVQSALIQIPRVARATGLSSARLRRLVLRQVEPPAWGLFGRRRINVVRLNLALYRLLHPRARLHLPGTVGS